MGDSGNDLRIVRSLHTGYPQSLRIRIAKRLEELSDAARGEAAAASEKPAEVRLSTLDSPGAFAALVLASGISLVR